MVTMKISELKDGTGKVDVKAKVVSKEEPRNVNTRYGATQVCNATIEDESGEIKLVLWGDDVEKIKEGDELEITNGYVNEWNGTLQLNVGKFGKMNVL